MKYAVCRSALFMLSVFLWIGSFSTKTILANGPNAALAAEFKNLFSAEPSPPNFRAAGVEITTVPGEAGVQDSFVMLRGKDSFRVEIDRTIEGQDKKHAILLRSDRSFELMGNSKDERPYRLLGTSGGKLWSDYESFNNHIGYRWWAMCYCLDETFFYHRVLRRVTQDEEGCQLLKFETSETGEFQARVVITEGTEKYEIEFAGSILGGKPYIYRHEWFPARDPNLSVRFAIGAQSRNLETFHKGRCVEKVAYEITEFEESLEFPPNAFSLAYFKLTESGVSIPSIWVISIMVLAGVFSLHWIWSRFSRTAH